LYDNKVRDAVLDRLIEDALSIPKILVAMQRDFFLDLSQGFVYDCIERRAAELDCADYRRWTLEKFSGTLCIDELHLGRHTLLLATDPIGDFPVAFALVESNDAEHMQRFLANLKRRGQRGRKRGRGRPKKTARKRRRLTLEDQSHFVFKHRYLIVTKDENLSDQQRADLRTMCQYLPELQTLRNFVIKVGRLFDTEQSPHQTHCRRAKLLSHPTFTAIPELAKALKMLEGDKFDKMIAFLRTSPTTSTGQSPRTRPLVIRPPVIRTNNHVERTNRKLRFFEKSRYKWRRRRSIVRFLLLAFNRWRQTHETAAHPDTSSNNSAPHQPKRHAA
jgi:hypothetical protein